MKRTLLILALLCASACAHSDRPLPAVLLGSVTLFGGGMVATAYQMHQADTKTDPVLITGMTVGLIGWGLAMWYVTQCDEDLVTYKERDKFVCEW